MTDRAFVQTTEFIVPKKTKTYTECTQTPPKQTHKQ